MNKYFQPGELYEMNKNIAWLCLGNCLLGSAAVADDNTSGGEIGLSFNVKRLEFNIPILHVNPDFNTLAINASRFYGRTYLSAEHEILVTDDTAYVFNTGGGVQNTLAFDRKDSGLTVGHNVWRGLSVFGGYKYGATTITALSASSDSQEFTNKTSGPFVGVSYGFRLGDGVLGVSIASADFKTKTEWRFLGPDGAATGPDIPGKTTGNSYGVTWSAPLTKELQYRLSLKINRYKFSVDDPNGDIVGTSQPAGIFNTDENYTIYGIAISKQF